MSMYYKCLYCKNWNPQCSSVFIEGMDNIERILNFININGLKRNYYIRKNNNPIPTMKIDFDCLGFVLNEKKKDEYEKLRAPGRD